jgi:hypothetical protein
MEIKINNHYFLGVAQDEHQRYSDTCKIPVRTECARVLPTYFRMLVRLISINGFVGNNNKMTKKKKKNALINYKTECAYLYGVHRATRNSANV